MRTLLVILLLEVPSIFVIADVIRLPTAAWTAIRVNRWAWIVVQVLLGTVGAVIYVLGIRPRVVGASDGGPARA